MFVDELVIDVFAGDGGEGVVRWRHEKYKPKAGPAGGNGGKGGDVYLRAVSDNNRLSKYTGNTKFYADSGEEGKGLSQHGQNASDLYIDIPAGSVVRDVDRGVVYTMQSVGEEIKILRGGAGGLGNEHFKSSVNRTPCQSTKGRSGQRATLHVEVALVVDVGLIGLPNAGKSSLLSTLTNATPRVGNYPFTTREPHLGDFNTYTIADIPGLIAGAASGKGLGHKFLRHITRTKMLLHVVSLEEVDPFTAYRTIRQELAEYDSALLEKPEWIILSKKDTMDPLAIEEMKDKFKDITQHIYSVSVMDDESIKVLSEKLLYELSRN